MNDSSRAGPAPSGPFPFPKAENPPDPRQPATPAAREVAETPSEDAIDHGVEESFPASDPVSVSVTKTGPDKYAGKDPGPAAPGKP